MGDDVRARVVAMTTTVKAAGAAEFLALVPRLLGYTAARSVVLVPLQAGRSVGAMRFDLPSGDGPPLEAFASTAVGLVCRVPGADGVIAVVYTDAPFGDAPPSAALVAALRRQTSITGLALVDAFVVAADGWASYDDPRVPPGGRPLAQILVRDATGLPEIDGDQSTGAELPARSAADRRRVGAAARSLRASLELLCGIPGINDGGETSDDPRPPRVDPAALSAACDLDDLPRLLEKALAWDPERLPPMDAALIGWCLSRPALRDIALVQWAGDVVAGEDALEAQRRWEDGADEYPPDLACVMWGEGRRPDAARLSRALELCRQVAALVSRRARPGALAACAWLSWALGRSTHAERYARRALEIDPRHGLSGIVCSFVSAGHLPDWVFRAAAGVPVRT